MEFATPQRLSLKSTSSTPGTPRQLSYRISCLKREMTRRDRQLADLELELYEAELESRRKDDRIEELVQCREKNKGVIARLQKDWDMQSAEVDELRRENRKTYGRTACVSTESGTTSVASSTDTQATEEQYIRLKNKVNTLEERIAAYERQEWSEAALTAKLECAEGVLKDLTRQRDEFEGLYHSYKSNFLRLKQEATSSDEGVEDVGKQNLLSEMYDMINEEFQEMVDKHQNLERSTSVLEEGYHLLKTDNLHLTKENTRLLEHNKQLSDDSARLSTDHSQLLERFDGLSKDNMQLSEDSTRLSTDHSQLLERFDGLSKDNMQLSEVNTRLLENNRQLSDDSARLSSDHSHLLERFARLSKDNTQLSEENTRLIEHNKQLSEDSARLSVDHSQLLERFIGLSKDNTQMSEDSAKLSVDSSQQLEKYSSLSADHKQLCAKYAELSRCNAQVSNDHAQLLKQYDNLREDHTMLSTDKSHVIDGNSGLKFRCCDSGGSIHQLETDNRYLSEKRVKLEILLNAQKENCCKLESNFVLAETDNRRLSEENTRLSGDNIQLSEENTRLSGDNIQLSEENARLSGENIQLSEESTRLSGDNIQLSEENTRFSEDKLQLSEDNSRLTEDKLRLSEDNLRLSEDKFKLSKDNSRLTEDKSQLSDDNSRLSEATSRLSEDISQLSEDNSRLSKDNSRLSDDNSRLTEDKSRLSDDNLRLSEDKLRFSKDNSRLTEDKLLLSEDNSRLSEDNSRLSDDNSRLSEDKLRLSEDNSRLSGDNSRLSDDKSRLSEENSRLSEEHTQFFGDKLRFSEENTRLFEVEMRMSEENKRLLADKSRLSEENKLLIEVEVRLSRENARLTADCSSLAVLNSELKSRTGFFNESRDTLETERTYLTTGYDVKKKEAVACGGQYAELKAELGSMTSAYNSLVGRHRLVEEELSKVMVKYEDLNASHTSLAGAKDQLQSSFNSVDDLCRKLHHEHAFLKEGFLILEGKNADLESRSKQRMDDYTKLESMYNVTVETKCSLEQRNNSLEHQCIDLERTVLESRKARDEVGAQLDVARKGRDTVCKQMGDLEARNGCLLEINHMLEYDKNDYLGTAERLATDVKSKEEYINELLADNGRLKLLVDHLKGEISSWPSQTNIEMAELQRINRHLDSTVAKLTLELDEGKDHVADLKTSNSVLTTNLMQSVEAKGRTENRLSSLRDDCHRFVVDVSDDVLASLSSRDKDVPRPADSLTDVKDQVQSLIRLCASDARALKDATEQVYGLTVEKRNADEQLDRLRQDVLLLGQRLVVKTDENVRLSTEHESRLLSMNHLLEESEKAQTVLTLTNNDAEHRLAVSQSRVDQVTKEKWLFSEDNDNLKSQVESLKENNTLMMRIKQQLLTENQKLSNELSQLHQQRDRADREQAERVPSSNAADTTIGSITTEPATTPANWMSMPAPLRIRRASGKTLPRGLQSRAEPQRKMETRSSDCLAKPLSTSNRDLVSLRASAPNIRDRLDSSTADESLNNSSAPLLPTHRKRKLDSQVLLENESEPNLMEFTRMPSKRTSLGGISGKRLQEIARRNTMAPVHLKSSYPVETQVIRPNIVSDDHLKEAMLSEQMEADLNNSLMSTTETLSEWQKSCRRDSPEGLSITGGDPVTTRRSPRPLVTLPNKPKTPKKNAVSFILGLTPKNVKRRLGHKRK